MKFSEITASKWDELQPYMDTCLLPITGMTGTEHPYEATMALEKLRDVMDLVEIPFKGRVVTYPACHYVGGEPESALLERLSLSLKRTGFRYVIAVTADSRLRLQSGAADLIIAPDEEGVLPEASVVSKAVQSMWRPPVPQSAV